MINMGLKIVEGIAMVAHGVATIQMAIVGFGFTPLSLAAGFFLNSVMDEFKRLYTTSRSFPEIIQAYETVKRVVKLTNQAFGLIQVVTIGASLIFFPGFLGLSWTSSVDPS
jgi:hypothetical protein